MLAKGFHRLVCLLIGRVPPSVWRDAPGHCRPGGVLPQAYRTAVGRPVDSGTHDASRAAPPRRTLSRPNPAWRALSTVPISRNVQETKSQVPILRYRPEAPHQVHMTEDIEPKSERTHQGRPLAALASVGRSLSGASSLQDAVPDALRTVCEACELDLGVLWWVDPALDRLRRMTTWRPFTPVDERVARLDAREHLDRGQDIPGRVWESGNPEIGTADGGGASAAFPVRVGSRIVGVLEACRSAGAFPEEVIRVLDGMVAQLGVLARAFEAEQTLRETSVRYRLLVEQIPAIVYTERVGQGLSNLYVSPQVEGLLGIEREQFMAGRPAWERHVHPDDRERA